MQIDDIHGFEFLTIPGMHILRFQLSLNLCQVPQEPSGSHASADFIILSLLYPLKYEWISNNYKWVNPL